MRLCRLALAGMAFAPALVFAGPCDGPREPGAHAGRHPGINHDLYCQLRATDGPVDATVLFAHPPPSRKALEAHVEDIGAWSDRYARATVYIEGVDAARALAGLGGVRRLQRIYSPLTNAMGAETPGDQGARASRAIRAHNHGWLLDGEAPDATGAGERIGVISDSFARTLHMSGGRPDTGREPTTAPYMLRASPLQQAGQLPSVVEIRRDDMNTEWAHPRDEGAAMAELAHDLAPDAAISFATGAGGLLGMARALDDLCRPRAQGGAGATVVVDDLTYPAAPMFQTGIAGAAANRCLERGVSVVSAAGNNGNAAVGGVFRDYAEAGTDGGQTTRRTDDFHEWRSGKPYLELSVPANGSAWLVLQWNQPWGGTGEPVAPGVDLDLQVFASPDKGGGLVASATNDQRADDLEAGAAPVEIVRLRNHGSRTETARIAVEHWGGPRDALPHLDGEPLRFRLALVSPQGTLHADDRERAPALFGHRTLPGVISVGAASWMGAPPFAEPPVVLRDTSARGGEVRRHFDSAGRRDVRQVTVPTVTGVDGVNNTIIASGDAGAMDGEPDGRPNFAGTSASAAVIAGVAAAWRSSAAARGPADVRRIIGGHTVQASPARSAGGGLYRAPDRMPGREAD